MGLFTHSSDSLHRAEQMVAQSGVSAIIKNKKAELTKKTLSKTAYQAKLKDQSNPLNPTQDQQELHNEINYAIQSKGRILVEESLKNLAEFKEFESDFFQSL